MKNVVIWVMGNVSDVGNVSAVLLNHNDYQAVQCKKIK